MTETSHGTTGLFRRLHKGGPVVALGSASLLAVLATVTFVSAASGITVSQKGRAFHPTSLDLKVGDTVTIVNDDGDLLHHAFVDSPTFSYDSGDQQPGSKIDIVFSKTGTFSVLCGIHPKMKMAVTVR